jgi:hypothetical protein
VGFFDDGGVIGTTGRMLEESELNPGSRGIICGDLFALISCPCVASQLRWTTTY